MIVIWIYINGSNKYLFLIFFYIPILIFFTYRLHTISYGVLQSATTLVTVYYNPLTTLVMVYYNPYNLSYGKLQPAYSSNGLRKCW
jgi:hypothetical protein